ncbi:MAG: transglycosylase SLT domain-containing protein [Candidatus Woesearchaeota archaeon]
MTTNFLNKRIPTYFSLLAATILGWHSQADASPGLEERFTPSTHISLPAFPITPPPLNILESSLFYLTSSRMTFDSITHFGEEIKESIDLIGLNYRTFQEKERRVERAYNTYCNREGLVYNFTHTINSNKYEPLISQAQDLAEKEYDVEIPYSLFVSLVQGESSWCTTVTSPAGAQGLGQLMPGTAKDLGYSNRTSPKQLLAVGKLLGWTYKKYETEFPDISVEQRWDWVLAGYNYGMNGLPSLARNKKARYYWELQQKDIGQEGYEFVAKIRGIERTFIRHYQTPRISQKDLLKLPPIL